MYIWKVYVQRKGGDYKYLIDEIVRVCGEINVEVECGVWLRKYSMYSGQFCMERSRNMSKRGKVFHVVTSCMY